MYWSQKPEGFVVPLAILLSDGNVSCDIILYQALCASVISISNFTTWKAGGFLHTITTLNLKCTALNAIWYFFLSISALSDSYMPQIICNVDANRNMEDKWSNIQDSCQIKFSFAKSLHLRAQFKINTLPRPLQLQDKSALHSLQLPKINKTCIDCNWCLSEW